MNNKLFFKILRAISRVLRWLKRVCIECAPE